MTAVKKKMRKILQSKNYIFFYFLKPNEEEQETKQFQMDTAVAEEYIEYYADKYKELTAKHKFAIPLCKHTDESEIYVVPQRSWGDRSDTDHSKCLLLGGRRLNLLTVIPKPKGSGGARAATAQIGPANERNKTK